MNDQRASSHRYADNPRVSAFLERGCPEPDDQWIDQPPECLPEDIPDLLRMMSDHDLLFSYEENEWAAPQYAWRELGKMRASAMIQPLLELLAMPWQEQDMEGWDEVRGVEFPDVFALIGEPAIAPLEEVLSDKEQDLPVRAVASNAIMTIGFAHPEFREQGCKILTRALKEFLENSRILNGQIIGCLVDLRAGGSIDIIRSAFEADAVDLTMCGDLEDVEIELGLRTERSTPRPNYMELEYPEQAHQMTHLMELMDLLEGHESFDDEIESRPPIASKEKKVGRNDPCPCGSGKKYKKCCLAS